MMGSKSGITMTSIVIYVVVFFAITILATGVTMSMNSNSLQDKGKIYIEESNMKVKKNIKYSLDNSDSFYLISNKLVFSNKDEYYYDSLNMNLYKNGGILVQNVKSFDVKIKEKNGIKYAICLSYSIEKYNQTIDLEFNLFKGEDINGE